MKHLILVGACYVDTVLSVPHYPQEDAKQRASSLKIRRGGNCPNSLEVLQQLVGPQDALCMHLVSPLPSKSSLATRHIKESFGESSPVDFEHCLYRETHTQAASSYIFRSQQTGSRTIINYNDLPEMTVDEFEAVVRRFNPSDETWWHFEVSPVQLKGENTLLAALCEAAPANGRVKRETPQHLILRHPFNNPCLTIPAQGRIPNTTLECVRRLRDKLPNAQISVEVEKPGRDGLRELAAEANVVFYSRSWAESCGHGSAESCLVDEQRRREASSTSRSLALLVCTWGADGASMCQSSEQIVHCPVESRAKSISVVDSVGAGDTFVAGMLYSLVCRDRSWDVSHGLRFAVHLATTKVQREGFQGLGAHVHDWLVGNAS